jgi:hypothetical protein
MPISHRGCAVCACQVIRQQLAPRHDDLKSLLQCFLKELTQRTKEEAKQPRALAIELPEAGPPLLPSASLGEAPSTSSQSGREESPNVNVADVDESVQGPDM